MPIERCLNCEQPFFSSGKGNRVCAPCKMEPASFTPARPFFVGQTVALPNPLTLWDRLRMFFGLDRASPATNGWVCISTQTSSPGHVQMHVGEGDRPEWGGSSAEAHR